MTKTNKIMVALCATISLIMASCSSRDVYNEYVALPNTGWGTDSLAVFRANIDNTQPPYNIWLQIRNQNNYPYSNVWFFVDVISPDGYTLRDTLECTLAMPDGTWIGSGWGSLYSLQCPYRLGSRFAEKGTYTFRIAHGMRNNDIKGIHSIGLRIETATDEE